MISSPVGGFVSELQTSEIPERIMKHGVQKVETLLPDAAYA
jgi:hypothetical protein